MADLRGRPTWRSSNPDENAVNNLSVGLQQHDGLVAGCGTAASQKVSSAVGKNFMSFYLNSTAISGTSRGMYLRLYLGSNAAAAAAGGEALRAFTTVTTNAPADTCNGAHISLNFGATYGQISGEASAVKATFHVPAGRTIAGTCDAICLALCSDGADGTASNLSFIRCVFDGNATGAAVIDDAVNFLNIVGPAGLIGDNALVRTNTSVTHSIKSFINGVRYDICCTSSHA